MNNISLNLAYDFVNQYSQILPNEQFTLLTLIMLLGSDYKGQVHKSAVDIAKITGFDSRTIQHHVGKLKIREIITIENTFIGDGGYSGCNKYGVVGWAQWVESHE